MDNPDPSLLREEFEGATTSSESRPDNNSTKSAGHCENSDDIVWTVAIIWNETTDRWDKELTW